MPCNDLTGSPWLKGVLVRERTEEIVDVDPPLRFVLDGNQLYAVFSGSADRFRVTCTEEGNRRRVSFQRVVGNVTTDYSGVAAPVADRATFFMVRGTFTRSTLAADGSRTIIAGDWETEKPT